jgi:hypothetical protein
MTTYKLIKGGIENKVYAILRNGKDSIPMVEDNTDYQAFLLWKAQGNEPTPADEGTQ